MVIRVLEGRHLPASVTGAWSELQAAEPTLASPFYRPEFTEIVAASRSDVGVALLGDAGYFPFQRARFGAGRPVGSRLSDHHGLVAPPQTELDVQKLLRSCRLSTWEFDGLAAAQRAFDAFHETRRASPLIELAGGFQAFAVARHAAGSSIVAESERKAERLARQLGPLRFEPQVADPQLLDRLLGWKSDQYVRTGAVDIFRYGWVRDVVRRAQAMRRPAFAGMLSVLSAGDRSVAIHFGIRSASVWHWWLPAYDPAFAKYSPGTILLARMAESAPELGLTVIDLGKGDALYKQRFATSSVEVASGVIQRPSLASAERVLERTANAILYHTPARAAALRSATRRRLR